MHGARAEALHRIAAATIRPRAGLGLVSTRQYTVLEGVGALLIEESAVDRRAIEDDPGTTVYDNVRVSAVETIPSVPADSGSPDDWHLERINVAGMRSKGLTGKGSLIGVLDSGIAASHPEFAGKQIFFAQFDKDGQQLQGAPPKDFGNHGTHVSGLIAGSTAGSAPDSALAVAAVLTVHGENGYLAQILGGLNWLIKSDFRGMGANPGVHLVNASLEVRPFNGFLEQALEAAARAPGVLAVAASGNKGSGGIDQVASPGNYSTTLGVGATGLNDEVASFSDWGRAGNSVLKPDLVAPGVNILSAVPPDQYQRMSGTSMASGIVCGAAALLIEQDGSLAHDPARLKDSLLRSVVPVTDHPDRAGRGRLAL